LINVLFYQNDIEFIYQILYIKFIKPLEKIRLMRYFISIAQTWFPCLEEYPSFFLKLHIK